MAATVIFHRQALQEYQDALQWYGRRTLRAAQALARAVDAAVQQMSTAPTRWPVVHQHYRWVRTPRYPYVLYYRILDPDTVLVMAVAHARRRPGYWLRRQP